MISHPQKLPGGNFTSDFSEEQTAFREACIGILASLASAERQIEEMFGTN